MEATIDGRRYWKEGDQWYRLLDKSEYSQAWPGFQSLLSNGEWTANSFHNDVAIPRQHRVPCDDPTAAPVVKEGDTVQTPMGSGKVVKPESGTIQPVFPDKPSKWRVCLNAKNIPQHADRSSGIVSIFGHTVEVDGIDRSDAVIKVIGEMFPEKRFAITFDKSIRIGQFDAEVTFQLGGIPSLHIWGKIERIPESGKADDSPQPVAVALKDSQPDEENHKAKEKLLTPADPVAKTSTITLRDQLALNASPEYVEQVKRRESDSLRCHFPTDAEVRYIIADEMLKTREVQ